MLSTEEIRWFDNSVLVEVTDGKLTVTNGTGSNNNKLNFIKIESWQGSVPTPTPTPPPTATAAPSPNQFTLQRAVQQGSDDAEQNRTTGQVFLYNSKLNLASNGSNPYKERGGGRPVRLMGQAWPMPPSCTSPTPCHRL